MDRGQALRRIAAKVGPPFAISALLAGAMFFGGDAWRIIGLQALESTGSVIGRLLSVAAIFSIAVLAQRVVRYVVLEGMLGSAFGGPVPRLLPQLTGLVIYVVAGAAVASNVFNQDLTALWAASGVAGVVFGMALREMILDVFSGLAINLDRPIRIGDRVQLLRPGMTALMGRVAEISWRSTRIYTEDCNMAVVPNSIIAGSTIVNMSLPEPVLEFLLPVTLDNDVDPERAMRILTAAAREASAGFAAPDAPPAYVRLRGVTPGGAEYGVFIFPVPENRYRARSETLAVILRHLTLAGLQPAWPKQERRLEDASSDGAAGAATLATAQVVNLLRGDPLLGDTPVMALERLAGEGRRSRVAAGAVIAQAGEVATAFFLVLEGLAQQQPGGAYRGPGAVTGAAAMLGGGCYEHTLIAAADALLLTFDQAAVLAMLGGDLATARRLADRLAAEQAAASGLTAEQTADFAADVLGGLRRAYGLALPASALPK